MIFDREFSGYGANILEAVHLAHGFVEDESDDAAVNKTAAALIFGAEAEIASNVLGGVILFEREEHAAGIGAAAAEAGIRRIGCE